MILICGIPSEPPVSLVINSAEEKSIDYCIFNQRESHFVDINLEIMNGLIQGTLSLGSNDIYLQKLSGVYQRLMDFRELPENHIVYLSSTKNKKILKSYYLHETFNEWLEVANCRIMNRNSAMNSNISKPYQAQIILRIGFRTPETLISNNLKTVKDFVSSHEKIVYKSISSIRSIVKELTNEKINDLDKIEYLPTQFQIYVPGTNIRVHVAGKQIFATEIISDAIDYRYARREQLDVDMKPINLPRKIEKKCFLLSEILQLPLCGIDLKRTPDNHYYCFEVNPSPAFSYYQETTGQNISEAIVKFLGE